VEANSAGGQGSQRAVAPSGGGDDDDDDDDISYLKMKVVIFLKLLLLHP
jgi:hypothetical protein